MISETCQNPADLPAGLRFLAGGGEATRLILARDWSAHPLGSPAAWPVTLKTALSTILNSPESMILAWGRDDLHFFFNETYFPLLGPRLPWATGTPFREVWADGWAQAKPIIDDAFAGRSRRFDDLPWKLGTDRGPADTWFTFSYSRILDADGDIAGLFIFTNETTERVLADAALRDSEEQLRLVVEGAKDHAIFTTDPDGVITSWSPGACLIFGWTREEAIGQSASMIFTPEDRAAGADVQELTNAAAQGCANDERWHVTKSGARVFMNGSVHPLPLNAQGRSPGFIKVARDDTERWHNRQALEAQNISLEQRVAEATADRDRTWNNARDLLVVLDKAGVLRSVNPAWTAVLGWRGEELVGRSFMDFIHSDDGPSSNGALSTASREGLSAYENRYRHKDGGWRWISWVAAPEHELIYASGRDITEQKAAAAALALAENQLRQAQKMEAVGQLTGGIAHDFNNMLTGVIGSLELLKRHLDAGRVERADRYIDAATLSANRAAALTQRLLAFSRRQSLDVQPVDVAGVVTGLEELLRRTLGEQVALRIENAPGTWPALTDTNQLESALLNLAINARDAMPDGGELTIRTGNVALNNRYTDGVDAAEAGDYVKIAVRDTGTGMTAEVVAKAFDPFFTTKPIGQGTGLGLSMIYGFARQTGGHARIHSVEGQGTTIDLYLRRHVGEAPDFSAGAAAPLPPDGSGERVLVVEDEPAVRMLTVEVLQDLGYCVLEAADGPAALDLLDNAPPIDLLVTDVGLPGLNGREVAALFRARMPELKVLFVTGYAEAAAVRSVFLDAGMDMIAKPFAIDVLATKVREMLA